MPLSLAAAVYFRLPALMFATDTNCPAVTATPESARVPKPGRVVILTLEKLFAGRSSGSTNAKSAAVKVYAVSSIARTASLAPAGASFTLVTVSTKVSLADAKPSLTTSVMVTSPCWFGAGVIVTVRDAPLPPITMLAFGTSVWSDDVATTVSMAAAVSVSPTVNAMAPVAVSSSVAWSATLEMVGAVSWRNAM